MLMSCFPPQIPIEGTIIGKDVSLENPVINPSVMRKKHRYVYGIGISTDANRGQVGGEPVKGCPCVDFLNISVRLLHKSLDFSSKLNTNSVKTSNL